MLLKDSSHSHLWCRTVRSSNNRFFVLSRFQISSFSIRKYFLFSRLRLNENDFKAKHLTASLNIILTWWNDSKIFWSLKYFPEFPPVRGVLTEGLARWGRSGGGIYFCVGLADFLISVMTIQGRGGGYGQWRRCCDPAPSPLYLFMIIARTVQFEQSQSVTPPDVKIAGRYREQDWG